MGHKKALTTDCPSCDLCVINEDNNFTCTWGKGKPKIMFPKKGKKPLFCKLERNDK
jgi:hypothetical protein